MWSLIKLKQRVAFVLNKNLSNILLLSLLHVNYIQVLSNIKYVITVRLGLGFILI